jgi:hypothetical protein
VVSLALFEQNLHALRHVDPQKHIRIANNGRNNSQSDSLQDRVLRQILLPERLDAEIPLDDKGTVKPAKDADYQIEQNLKEVP